MTETNRYPISKTPTTPTTISSMVHILSRECANRAHNPNAAMVITR
jgi:hypothetical protein